MLNKEGMIECTKTSNVTLTIFVGLTVMGLVRRNCIEKYTRNAVELKNAVCKRWSSNWIEVAVFPNGVWLAWRNRTIFACSTLAMSCFCETWSSLVGLGTHGMLFADFIKFYQQLKTFKW